MKTILVCLERKKNSKNFDPFSKCKFFDKRITTSDQQLRRA